MKNIIRKSWRDAATLIVLAHRNAELMQSCRISAGVNYDILLQTRTGGGSFPNSVVFPGGVSESADSADSWTKLFTSFGYTERDFESLHRPSSAVTPIFQDNPVQRHISLRITAIRETFEELGLLICSRTHKKDRSGIYADIVTDADTKHWRERLIKNPGELLNLCKEYNCYPDIWSLHYWSNWLTPIHLSKRFDTAFFVTALATKPHITSNSEVAKVEWSSPLEVLSKSDIVLYPPQAYEFFRLSHIPQLNKLIEFAKEKSCYGGGLLTSIIVKTKDGKIHAMPGDDLHASYVDYKDNKIVNLDKTILELRESSKTLHRLEVTKAEQQLVFKNYKPENHINMGDKVMPVNVTI